MQIYRFGELVELAQPLTPDDVQAIVDEAHRRTAALQALPLERILDLLDRVADAWATPDYPLRRRAVTELPGSIHFSGPMIEQGILAMIDMLRRQNARTRLDCDLGDADYLDDWVYYPRFQGFLRAQPYGVVAHVSAGNVFVGGVDSLIQGILTKNVCLMKMASVDPLFPVLFAQSLRELDVDGVVSRSLALLAWPGGSSDVERVLKQGCDAIVVYGGAETIRSYRQDLGLHTRLIEYGPKYSFMLVDGAELTRHDLADAARRMARDVVMWEQSACSSPHAIYLESPPGTPTAEELAAALGEALAAWAVELPPGGLTPDEGTEISRVRDMARVEQVMGSGELVAPHGTEWTVVVQHDPAFQTSCLNRTVFVKPVPRLEDAVAALAPMGEYVQSVAILAALPRAQALGERLIRIGADRLVEIGHMARRKHGTPHDGTRGLAELVRWTSLAMAPDLAPPFDPHWRRYDARTDAFDFRPDDERDAITLARLRAIVAYAVAHAPYYAERYGDVRLDTLDDLRRLPLLSPEELKAHLPPHGTGLLTDEASGGYVFASGGTTDAPKVVYRTPEEQHYNATRLGKSLALSVFGPGDVVANLLYAGNLWASFLSLNMALEHTGCRILPIAGNFSLDQTVPYLRQFHANGVLCLPSTILGLAEYVEQQGLTDVRITKVATGGEHLFAGAREYMQRVLGVERFVSAGYAANDSGAIGYECERPEGTIHHVHEDLHHVEIIDPDTLEPVPPGEHGKIVVTNLQRRLMPTLRYDLGDQGRWLAEPCACGRRTRRFELLGRSDDVLIIGSASKLVPEVVAAAVSATPGLSENFQMVARMAAHLDQLLVRVERKPGAAADAAAVAAALRERIYEASKELRSLRDQGSIADIAVELLPPDGLPRNPRTGKIRTTVDERAL